VSAPPAAPFDAALAGAQSDARRWLDALPRAARVVVFCHFDADGLAAGAVAGRALPRLGFTDVRVVPSGKGESAFGEAARARLTALRPDALVVTDLGVNAAGVLPGVPTLYVDHHQPSGAPEAPAVVASGYAWDPVPNSSWLMWELLAPLAEAAGAPVDDLLWVAAVGTVSDLGEKAPWPRLADVRKRYTAKWLKEAVSLVNAARRASAFDVDTPLGLLMTADHPRAVSEDEAAGAARLRAYRAEVNAALAEARKRAPVFATGASPWALVPAPSPCQIHPLIAQQWRGRLPKHAVMGANARYVPDLVAFSCRTSRRELDLPALLRGAVDLGPWNAHFGNGHDHASGGHLPPAEFGRLLAALGFDARARAAAGAGE
jgi:single-stranded-DNA-specific exonuclease